METTLATIEFTLAAVCLTLLAVRFFGQSKYKSFQRARAVVFLITVWLFVDASSYVFVGPSYPFAVGATFNLLTYLLGNLILLAFVRYSDAYVRERTELNPWIFRVPQFFLIACCIATLIEFYLGHILIMENGYIIGSNQTPTYISAIQMLTLIYIPFVTLSKRKQISRYAVYLFGLLVLIPVTALIIYQFTAFDLTVIGSTVAMVLILTILQMEQMVKQMEKETEHNVLEQNYARFFALEDNFESLYDVNLDNGNYEVFVKGDFYQSNVLDRLKLSKDFFQDLQENIEAVVHPDDKDELCDLMTSENIRKVLSENEHYDHLYRIISEDTNEPVWFKMRFVYKDANKKNVVIGVFNASKDMEAQQLAKQREELKRQLDIIGGLAEEYTALYHVNLDTGTYSSCLQVERPKFIDDLIAANPRFVDLTNAFANSPVVHPDNRNDMLDFYPSDEAVREALRDKKRLSVLFKHKFDEKYLWTEATIVKCENIDEEPHFILVGFIEKDREISERNARFKATEETNKLISNVAAAYSVAFTVNMVTNEFNLLRIDDKIINGVGTFNTYAGARSTLHKILHVDDRERMKLELSYDTIRRKLKTNKSYTVEYRTFINNVVKWHVMNVTYIDEDVVAMGFIENDLEITKRRLEDMEYNEYLALFVADIDTETIKPLKASPLFGSAPLGISAPYSASMRRFAALYEGEAKEYFSKLADIEFLKKDLATDDKRTLSYKSSKLSEDKWIDVVIYVILRHDDGSPAMITLSSSVIDTLATARKELHNRLEQNMQIIGGLASGYHTLYYFNNKENTVKCYELDEQLSPEVAQIINSGASAVEMLHAYGVSGIIHPDDKQFFEGLSMQYIFDRLAHNKRFSVRFRRLINGEYEWNEADIVKCEEIDEEPNAVVVGFATRDAEIRSEQALRSSFEILGMDLSPESAIDKLLNIAGEFYQADRSYVFEYSKKTGTFSNTYEWCADGIEPEISLHQDVPLSLIAGWNNIFRDQGTFYMNVSDDTFPGMKGVRNLVVAPIMNGDEIIGFMGVNNPSKAGTNTEVITSTATVVFNEILQRKETDEEHITLSKITDAFISVYYADLSTDYVKTLKIDENYKDICGNISKYSDAMECHMNDSRQIAMASPKYVLEQFKTDERFSISATAKLLGKERNLIFDYIKVSRDGNQFVICCRDVTDALASEKEQQRLLQEALQKAAIANKSKTDFLFNMSHDIRTPMNAIKGFTHMAFKNIDDKEKVLDCLTKTEKAEKMLLTLTNSILEVSRIESGKAELNEKPGDVYLSFTDIENTMLKMAESKDISLSFEFGAITDRYVYADFDRCMRIFVNIISNAIKYTKEGGYVRVRCKQIGKTRKGYGKYQYTIADNGIGMSEEFQQHVFEQFARESSSTVSGIEGTGLGMTVVKAFVDLMGGTIKVKSKQGVGTTFTVTLPFKLQNSENYVDPNTGNIVSASSSHECELKKHDFTGRKVLLVEDNELNREIAIDYLEEGNLVVEAVESGNKAIELLKKNGPHFYDFVLMDIQMPIMNGYEATRRIRMIYPDEHIPIIALSANAFAEDKKKSLMAGMDDHVAKPINTRELFEALSKLM